MYRRTVQIKSNRNELAELASEFIVLIASREMHHKSRFSVALSGGSTPLLLYSLLASERYASRVDWSRATFFFGDERNVPPDSEESNYRMANESLLTPLSIPPGQVHRWPTELGPVPAAHQYERMLETHGPLDVTLLGLGADAHTASLFPHTEALVETDKLAVANWVEELRDYRLTMTFPAINESKYVIFVVSGEDKAKAVAEVLEGEFRPDDLPAQSVNPRLGTVHWLLDDAAASGLRRD